MLSRQEEEAERKAVFENDLQLLRQTGTFFSHGQAQALDTSGGRFGAAMGAPTVTGSTAIPKYPAASSSHQVELPPEQPLGYSVDDMPIEPSAVSVTAAEQLAPAGAAPSPTVAPPSDDGELGDAGASFSEIGGGPALEEFPASGSTAKVGSPPTNDGDRR
jgi:hypothetical protein